MRLRVLAMYACLLVVCARSHTVSPGACSGYMPVLSVCVSCECELCVDMYVRVSGLYSQELQGSHGSSVPTLAQKASRALGRAL